MAGLRHDLAHGDALPREQVQAFLSCPFQPA
jgi:hypothetical protein